MAVRTPDVVVIGAGVVGLTTGICLAEAGLFTAFAKTRAAGIPHCVIALARAYLGQRPS